MGVLTALLAISFLVFFHELGHFLAARYFKVKVEAFSIGFGKVLFSKKYGDTEYCLSAIPLGGYVKMKGQDDSDPTKTSYEEDGYGGKPPWQRIIILFAGPAANFILAFFLYIAIGNLGVVKIAPQVGKISPNSAAFEARLEVNDTILSIDGTNIEHWEQIKPLVINSKDEIVLKIKRGNEILTKTLTPKIGENKNMFKETIKEKLIGFQMPFKTIEIKDKDGKPKKVQVPVSVKIYYKGFDSVKFAYKETIWATKLIILGLEKLIEGVVSPKDMGGIVAIVKVTSDAVNYGIVALFGLVALISVNLGVINLFPIPALDGGHIMFNVYEMIFKRPPNEKVYTRLMYAGWVFLLSLIAFTIVNDILRLTGAYD